MHIDEFLLRFHLHVNSSQEPDYPLQQRGRPAAVLIPLVNRNGQLSILLTQRAKHLKHHPGQVSFPGGAADDSDDNLQYTALRETKEELGIDPANVTIIGRLTSYRTISRYEVSPFVGLLPGNLSLKPDENEVADVFEIPLSYAMNQSNHEIYHINKGDIKFPVYSIVWQNHLVWGATAAILRNLSHHLSS